MPEPGTAPRPEGVEIFVITYDDEGNEVRYLPSTLPADVPDRSSNLGIGTGTEEIYRLKHGPLIAADSEIRNVNIGSLGRAIEANPYGTVLLIDRSVPPVNEDLLDIDDRYHLDVRDGGLVAIVTQRYPTRPEKTSQEMAAPLGRVAAAYDCTIVDVSVALPDGLTADEILAGIPEDEDWGVEFRAETTERLAGSAHDIEVVLAADRGAVVGALIAGAAALADFLQATQEGPLTAEGVLNLLRGRHFDALLGQEESGHLEVKAAMHPIWISGTTGERAKIELAQDVARFANGDVDAVLVVGYREGKSDEIASLAPVTSNYLNLAQINEVLDARIVPPIDGLIIEKFTISAEECVLAIFVPKQPSEMQPFLVHGAIVGDKVEGAFFSIVRRRGEGSITTSAQQIHAYIVAGRRYLRGND